MKQDIAIIRSHINTFYLIIMKNVNILDELLLNLPRIKPRMSNDIFFFTRTYYI